jgi:uncharacterized protein with GYD domain
MAKYLIEARYGPEGAKGVAAAGGTARRDAVARLFESAGGKLEAFYFALGETDAYVLGELPDNETAAALALAVNSVGAVSITTRVLLTPEQVDTAARSSIDYRPPGS